MRCALVCLLGLSGCFGISGLGDFTVDEGAGGAGTGGGGGTSTDDVGGSGSTTSTGGNGAGDPGCSLVGVSDDFSGALDRVWEPSGASAFGEQLVLELPAGSSMQYRGVTTSMAYDLLGHCTIVQIIRGPGASNAQTFFYAGPAANRVGFQLQGGQLRFVRRVDDAQPGTTQVDFDLDTHRYWRLWELQGEVTWSTSADGKSWTEHRRAMTPDIGLDHVAFQLGIYSNGGADKTVVIYDDFNRL